MEIRGVLLARHDHPHALRRYMSIQAAPHSCENTLLATTMPLRHSFRRLRPNRRKPLYSLHFPAESPVSLRKRMAPMKRALCLKEALTRATPLPVNHYERVSPGSTKVNVRWVGYWVFTMSNPTCVCRTNRTPATMTSTTPTVTLGFRNPSQQLWVSTDVGVAMLRIGFGALPLQAKQIHLRTAKQSINAVPKTRHLGCCGTSRRFEIKSAQRSDKQTHEAKKLHRFPEQRSGRIARIGALTE